MTRIFFPISIGIGIGILVGIVLNIILNSKMAAKLSGSKVKAACLLMGLPVILSLAVVFTLHIVFNKETDKVNVEEYAVNVNSSVVSEEDSSKNVALTEITTKEQKPSEPDITETIPSTGIENESINEKESETASQDVEIPTEKATENTSATVPPAPSYTGDPNDVTAPKILTLNSYVTLKVGSTFDPTKYIGYGDDIDRHPMLSVDGTVDTNTVGTYNVKFIVRDATGNTSSANITVNVVENIDNPPGGGDAQYYYFEDFIKNYKKDNTSLGIDVSRWQGDIDFEKVKAAGCEFVIIRLGYYSGGTTELDSCFKQNIARAKAAGLKVGIYYYSEDYNTEDLKSHVAWIFSTLGDNTLDFPVAFDWEDFGAFEEYGMNFKDINELYKVFESEVRKYGYEAMLYSSKNYLQNVWTDTSNYNVWLAHYTDVTSYSGNYFLWQKDCTGKIDGINAYVDLNVLYR